MRTTIHLVIEGVLVLVIIVLVAWGYRTLRDMFRES